MNAVILQQPKRVLLGDGTTRLLPEEFSRHNWKRIFVVSGPRVAAAQAGLCDTCEARADVMLGAYFGGLCLGPAIRRRSKPGPVP